MNLSQIFKNNQAWIVEKLELDPEYFQKLARGQHPNILYIGCSDSRVTAEDLMGAQPGEVFIHRNIANLVPNNDLSAMSVINYAVDHLLVKHIVVCGHYGCGGVQAALQHADQGILNPWLRNIRDVYRLYKKELNAIQDDEARSKKLVELNVREQCVNVIKTAEVQQAHLARGLTVHGWVLDIHTGRLIDLNLDFDRLLAGIMEIYRIS